GGCRDRRGGGKGPAGERHCADDSRGRAAARVRPAADERAGGGGRQPVRPPRAAGRRARGARCAGRRAPDQHPAARQGSAPPRARARRRRRRRSGGRARGPRTGAAIPEMLRARGLLLAAEAGCGKTLAYLLPLFSLLRAGEEGGLVLRGRSPRALVVVPTNELVAQVAAVARTVAQTAPLRVRPLAGSA